MTAAADIVEDIIKAVDANPLALEALRARLLTRELLELPTRVARLEETVARLEETVAQLAESVARLAESQARLEESLARFVESTNERMDAQETTLREFMLKTETAFSALRHDMGVLKGHYARDLAEKMAFSIADEHGFRFKGVLPQQALWEMINAADTSGISRDDLRSFSVADLIIEAADADGADCYIVAEISYTAHWDDAERAIRNAEFIARFAERPAHPLVAGVDVNERVRKFVIDEGKALWVRLPDRMLQAD